MNRVTLTLEATRQLIVDVLLNHATGAPSARSVADGLLAAEVDGQPAHGLSRLPFYAGQAASGKVDGHATPRATACASAAWRIDAGHGFAFPALDLAVRCLAEHVRGHGIGIATVHRSHHAGQAGYHVERLAGHGLVGLMFANSPEAIAPWGGSKPLFGTNPIAFAAPRHDDQPLVIDTSLAKVARGKVMLAARAGERIPEGWALDPAGLPTEDPEAALAGSMLPMGGAKGAALVLMVELLAAALSGAHFGYEATSFFAAEGAPPGVGQTLIAIDPGPLSGGTFAGRLEALMTAILEQPGTRLPGAQKSARRVLAARNGITLPQTLLDELRGLATTSA